MKLLAVNLPERQRFRLPLQWLSLHQLTPACIIDTRWHSPERFRSLFAVPRSPPSPTFTLLFCSRLTAGHSHLCFSLASTFNLIFKNNHVVDLTINWLLLAWLWLKYCMLTSYLQMWPAYPELVLSYATANSCFSLLVPLCVFMIHGC